MKLAYLLQTVRGLPLGYDFRLYSYGPFDSDALSDLDRAESLGLVSAQMVRFPSGYGYEFSLGPKNSLGSEPLNKGCEGYESEIAWALKEFGNSSAADLELITTIVYVDREMVSREEESSVEDLARTVKEVKPRFGDAYIIEKIKDLAKKELLVATK